MFCTQKKNLKDPTVEVKLFVDASMFPVLCW